MELEQFIAVSVRYHPVQLSERGIKLTADFVSHWPTEQPRVLTIVGGDASYFPAHLANEPTVQMAHTIANKTRRLRWGFISETEDE